MARTSTIICLRWKKSGAIEHFSNLGKLYKKYDIQKLGVSRFTLDRKDLWFGYINEEIEILKSTIQ
jgi:hypothetical protein